MSSKLPTLNRMGFDEKYALFESLNMLFPRIQGALADIKNLDLEGILGNPKMTPLDIYKKGFNSLPRLIEELALDIKNHNPTKNGNK